MIKNVFFDLDGTIVDSSPGIYEGLRIALKKFGYDEPEESVLHECVGPPFKYSFPNILHIKAEDFDGTVAAYREFYNNGGYLKCILYPGIKDLLEGLVKRGYSLNICSSKPEHVCKKLLHDIGVDCYFFDIVGATPDARIDTKQEVIAECFRRAPWKKKDETILIGDTRFDAEGAKLYGIDCLGITWGFGSKDELIENGATIVVDTCEEVLNYIEKH